MKKFKGFSFIELLLTLFVIMIGIGASVSLILLAMGVSIKVRNQIFAATLAQEAIEIIRNIRDSNWIQDRDWTIGLQNTSDGQECTPQQPIYCPFSANANWDSTSLFNIRQGNTESLQDRIYFDTTTSRFSHHPTGTPTPFSRRVVISFKDDLEIGKKYMELKSIVSWQEKGRERRIEVNDRLYDWRTP